MTLQEIQYKAQGIIHKWRDDDSAPYIEFVEELAHMIVPEPSKDLEEAAEEYSKKVSDGHNYRDLRVGFIAGYKYHADHTPLPEDTVLFQKGVEEGKRLMMEEAVEGEFTKDNRGNNVVRSGVFNKDFEYGDKVRIIILPKEDDR